MHSFCSFRVSFVLRRRALQLAQRRLLLAPDRLMKSLSYCRGVRDFVSFTFETRFTTRQDWLYGRLNQDAQLALMERRRQS